MARDAWNARTERLLYLEGEVLRLLDLMGEVRRFQTAAIARESYNLGLNSARARQS